MSNFNTSSIDRKTSFFNGNKFLVIRNFSTYYEVLELEPSASKKEIKTAFRKLAKKYNTIFL